jgi:hypothetical protein
MSGKAVEPIGLGRSEGDIGFWNVKDVYEIRKISWRTQVGLVHHGRDGEDSRYVLFCDVGTAVNYCRKRGYTVDGYDVVSDEQRRRCRSLKGGSRWWWDAPWW